jgi:pimeloyl-ACP methyl ester carboxylesterase
MDTTHQGLIGRTYPSDDGLTLHLRDYGQQVPGVQARLPVICLPGLTRNSRDFHQLAMILSQDSIAPRRVIALDYRGRGLSDRDDNKANYNLCVEAQDVLTACRHLGIDKAIFIGTSRGGLILHFLIEMRPDLIAAVVLNDIGPQIEAEGLIQIRDDLNGAAGPKDWGDAAAMLKARHAARFPALANRDWEEIAVAIYREIDGSPVADADPAIALQLTSIDFGKPLPTLWPQYDAFSSCPLMVVRGENSALLSEAAVSAMAERHRDLNVVSAPGQGHPPLLHIEPVLQRIRTFLADL